jgi:DNA helicase-2/ATP-dependent DNA helicase PcrA
MLTQDEDHQGAIKELLPVLFLKQQALQEAKMNSVLQNLTFLEALTTIESAAPFQIKKIEKLIKLIRTIKMLPPLEAIERLEESPAFMDYLKKRGNEANKIERPSDDIRDLKVVSKNFKSQREFVEHAFHISAKFKEYRSQKNKQSTLCISLLTAHRSKGLEYDYVYLLGTVDGGFPHDYALEALKNGDSTQIEEERRLLYVAITRARNSLYLSILQRRRNKKANPSRLIKRLIPR